MEHVLDITLTATAVLLATLEVLLSSPAIEIIGLVLGAIALGVLIGRAITN